MREITTTSFGCLALVGCLLGAILLFSNPAVAFQESHKSALKQLSPFSSKAFSRRRDPLSSQPIKGVNTSVIESNPSTLSPTSLFIAGNKLVLESMIANKNSVAVAVAAAVTTIAVVTSISSWRRTLQIQDELDSMKEENEKLKTTNHQREASVSGSSRLTSSGDNRNPGKKSDKREKVQDRKQHHEEEENLSVMRIGVIRSIYRLCVGTPRQGLLAPDARGRIELDKIGDSSTGATVSGLEDFSYIWVLFHFHLNTQSANKKRRFKSKIAPPALGGKKVGIYATRSPHRHNPIGITLCKLDHIQVHGPHEVTLHVSGLDLVDGTPVLDIKPYVPVYDSVNVISQTENRIPFSDTAGKVPSLTPQPSAINFQLPSPRVPGWVERGLATKRNVVITENAKNELEKILLHDTQALEFYGPHCFADINDDADNTMEIMLRVIQQVLSIDVRSSHQTRKARAGRSQAERAERIRNRFDVEPVLNPSNAGEKPKTDAILSCITEELADKKICTQQLDNLLISFSVKETDAKRESSEGSGAEDSITVENIKLLPNTEKRKRSKR